MMLLLSVGLRSPTEMPIVGHTVEWTVPGTRQYALVTNGVIHDGNITYLRVSFSNVLAREEYQYRVKAMNSLWRESSYIFATISLPKGMLHYTAVYMI